MQEWAARTGRPVRELLLAKSRFSALGSSHVCCDLSDAAILLKQLQESVEDDWRLFAKRSGHTEVCSFPLPRHATS